MTLMLVNKLHKLNLKQYLIIFSLKRFSEKKRHLSLIKAILIGITLVFFIFMN